MPVISKFTVGGHPVTKYNNQRLRQFVINGETCPFAKVAESLNGTLPDPISYRIHRLQASGNSSQATGSVPKYICQGASSVLNIGSIIASDVMTVPNTNHGITATFNATNGTWVCTGTSDAVSFVSLYNQITLTSGHKYLVPAYRDATQAATTYYRWGGKAITSVPAANFYWPDQSSSRSWAIITGDGTTGYCTFTFRSGLDTEVSGFEPAGCFNLIDLTELYGAGNEPANPETVFQDYPEIPVGNDSWIKNNVIRSISSITLGGHTVSVDLRSAGSVYDEWASNGHGTRKCVEQTYDATGWSWNSENSCYVHAKPAGAIANQTNFLLSDTRYTIAAYELVGQTDFAFLGYSNINIRDSRYSGAADLAAFSAYISGLTIVVALTSGNYQAITSTPLTLASGLTPTDQDGNTVTFTEGTEATPSPNYPVPIVNSTLISITDGQDTNSAAVDLAGLTDKDEVYVNVPIYKGCEYIESSGTQYIDTGVKLNQSSRVQIKYQYVGTPSTARVFGDATDSNKGWMITTQNGAINTKIQTLYGDDWRPTSSDPASVIPNNDIVEYERNGAAQYVNGELYYTNNASTFQTSGNAMIFGAYYLNMAMSSVRIYGCKIWNGGTLVRDFVPVYRIDGVPGLLDKVNSVFYENAGTGTFSKGPDTSYSWGKGKVWHKANNQKYTFDGSETWSKDSYNRCFFTYPSALSGMKTIGTSVVTTILSNKYKAAARNIIIDVNHRNDDGLIAQGDNVAAIIVRDLAQDSLTAAQFASYATGLEILFPLASPVWTDITSSAMGAALLALETIEETSNTITINNSGVIDMVQYFTPI